MLSDALPTPARIGWVGCNYNKVNEFKGNETKSARTINKGMLG